jgi:hypothetical protein
MGQSELYLFLGCAFGSSVFYSLLTTYRQQRYIRQHGLPAAGTVVSLVPIHDPDYPDDLSNCRFHPIIRFQTHSGISIAVQYNRSMYPEWTVGQQLTVSYLPSDPQQILVPEHWDSNEDLLFAGMLLGAVAVLSSILMYLY